MGQVARIFKTRCGRGPGKRVYLGKRSSVAWLVVVRWTAGTEIVFTTSRATVGQGSMSDRPAANRRGYFGRQAYGIIKRPPPDGTSRTERWSCEPSSAFDEIGCLPTLKYNVKNVDKKKLLLLFDKIYCYITVKSICLLAFITNIHQIIPLTSETSDGSDFKSLRWSPTTPIIEVVFKNNKIYL